MSGFDPAAHRMVPDQRWFEDFSLGERFVLPSRTMTEALFAAFALASGDNHPVHYDVEYCRARGMPHMLAHGFQVAIQTAAGAGIFPAPGRGVAQGLPRAILPLPASGLRGRYALCRARSGRDHPQRTTGVLGLRSTVHNQRGVLVMEGRQRYLLRRRP